MNMKASFVVPSFPKEGKLGQPFYGGPNAKAKQCRSTTLFAFSYSSAGSIPGKARSAAETCDLSNFRPGCFLR